MAALSGMTGFGRAGGEAAWGAWTIEARSVNGRGLDVRVNAPGGFDALDRAIREMASARFKRGSLQVAVRIEPATVAAATVNTALLDALIKEWEARDGTAVTGGALATLMAVRGVVEAGTADLRAMAGEDAVVASLKAGAETALDALQAARLEEGASLNGMLTGILDQVETETKAALAAASDQPAAIKAKLDARLKDLLAGTDADADRVATEVAMAAGRADVREELDRLAAHVETGRAHLAGGSPIGRKLDFLSQELYREANTLCSKSASLGLTEAGLALKGLIDQFKEQAANVE